MKKSLKPFTILLIFITCYLMNIRYRNFYFLENIQVELISVNNKIEVGPDDVEALYDENYYLPDEIDKAVNQKYCGKPKCEFLFAYYQPEQETKANMHFRTFVNIAQVLKRTIVLTNVGNSRINSCQNYTFDF